MMPRKIAGNAVGRLNFAKASKKDVSDSKQGFTAAFLTDSLFQCF